MKMLILVYRTTFNVEILEVIDSLGISGYTIAPQVFGSGEQGRVSDSHAWPGYNRMLLSALDNENVVRVVVAMKELLDRHAKEGEQMPIRIFAIPCEQLL